MVDHVDIFMVDSGGVNIKVYLSLIGGEFPMLICFVWWNHVLEIHLRAPIEISGSCDLYEARCKRSAQAIKYSRSSQTLLNLQPLFLSAL